MALADRIDSPTNQAAHRTYRFTSTEMEAMTRGMRDTLIALLAVMLLSGVFPTVAAPTEPESISQISLTDLLVRRFGNLWPAERRLVAASEIGETADCTDLSGDNKMIRGDLLAWLCANPQAAAQLTYRGIWFVDAVIIGKVDLEWAKVSFPIGATSCVFKDMIELSRSHIRSFNLGGTSIKHLRADSTHFEGSVFLRYGFKAEGGVDLGNAKIDGDLECDGGQFVGNEKVLGLDADSIEVKGSVFLKDGFKAEGGVNLRTATIGGNLECDGGHFAGTEEKVALNLNSIEVKRHVFLRKGFKAEGGVDLTSARIDGDLDCCAAQYIANKTAFALNANSAEVKGGVLLFDGFKAVGKVDFRLAKIDGPLEIQGGRFTSEGKPALDLRRAKAASLINSQNGSTDGWPQDQFLWIDGLFYERIADISHPNADFQLGWIGLQPHDQFRSQPFDQLADVLRKMGLEEDARKVMIAKNVEHARYVQWRPEWLWYGFFGHLIGYGYSPWRAFILSLVIVGVGWWLFRRGFRRGLVTPTGDSKFLSVETDGVRPASDNYPKFNAFIYSLETFVPLVKFGLADKWEPNGNRRADDCKKNLPFPPKTGGWLRGYLWFHIIAGWVLSALWVGGITGLVKT